MFMSFKVLFPALLCAAVAGAAEAASFDCSLAKTPLEKKICANKRLSVLDSDMADSYRKAQEKLKGDAEALNELRLMQRRYLSQRAEGFGGPFLDLQDSMSSQVMLLAGLSGTQRGDMNGYWRNEFGSVTVTPGDNGVFNVEVSAADTVAGRWVCSFEGKGKRQGAALIVDQAEKPEPEDDWKLRVTLVGRLLKVEEIEPTKKSAQGYAGSRPYCGMNGQASGTFFPFDAPKGRGE